MSNKSKADQGEYRRRQARGRAAAFDPQNAIDKRPSSWAVQLEVLKGISFDVRRCSRGVEQHGAALAP